MSGNEVQEALVKALRLAPLASVAGLFGSLLVGMAPATAVVTNTVYVVQGFSVTNQVDLGSGFSTEYTGCSTPRDVSHSSASVMYNTATPSPLGAAFWAENFASTDVANGPSRVYDSLSDFTSATLEVLNQNPLGGKSEGARLYAFVYADDGTYWSGLSDLGPVPADSTWHTVAGDASATFTWLHYPHLPATGWPGQPINDTPFAGTIAQLEAQQLPAGDEGGRVGISMGCGGGTFGFDGATFGLGDTSATFDLESTGASVASVIPETFILYAGRSEGIECELRADDYLWYEQADLTLQAKPAGTQLWQNLATAAQHVPTDWIFGYPEFPRFNITPMLNTAYRCRWAGGDPSVSAPEPVLVADVLTVRSRSDHVTRGHPIVLHGSLRPLDPGRRILLYRGQSLVEHTRLDKNGHYRFVLPTHHAGLLELSVATKTTRKHVGSIIPYPIRVTKPRRFGGGLAPEPSGVREAVTAGFRA
jgi:hypothetical protein